MGGNTFHNHSPSVSLCYCVSVPRPDCVLRGGHVFLCTFSFIFSIFFTELRRWCRSSSRMWKTGSPDLPICFSSCFSASFSLLSALMLSAWYIWYVFITWKKVTQLLQHDCPHLSLRQRMRTVRCMAFMLKKFHLAMGSGGEPGCQ